jgi:5-oxoprolinase (ATP-hydrolysing) subunit B
MRIDPADLEGKLQDAWLHTREGAKTGRIIDIPVIYGGETGIDLAYIADLCGLAMDKVVELHASAEYTVYAIGSQPGFGYLAGLNDQLATPRRLVPRTRVEAGSVVIGGVQAGVISCTSPSGWHVIGHTEVRLFDPDRTKPVLLVPGDRIRFCVEGVKR